MRRRVSERIALAELAHGAARAGACLERRARRAPCSTASSAHQRELNAFITVTREQALAQAAQPPTRGCARGEAVPLTGMPIAHKDVFCTAGWQTTCGSRMLDELRLALRRHGRREACAAAGMVMLGKTNMDEFAMGSSNETCYFGPVRNPWDPDARARRLLGRLGGRGRRAPGAGGHRHRHRRLDPPAGGAVRRHRHQADLRPRVALRHDRLRLEPRSGRACSRERRGCGAAAERDGRLRSRATPPASSVPVPDYVRRARSSRWQGPAHRRAEGILRRGPGCRRSSSACARRWPSYAALGARARRREPAAICRCRCRSTT